jgi:DNA-directed RNA polymerase specialized sigma24 family protein
MSKRRIDTKHQMEKFLDGNLNAFNNIYERYSGRIYRFIVRQLGTGPQARSLYMTVWAEFVDARKEHTSPGQYKISLYKILYRCLQNCNTEQALPNDTQKLSGNTDGSQPRIKLLNHLRALPQPLREAFLLRHEIGLKTTLIARIIEEPVSETERKIDQAIVLLEQEMIELNHLEEPVLAIYRNSRMLKSPTLWDKEIYASLPIWMEIGIQSTLINEGMMDKKGLFKSFSRSLNEAKRHVHDLTDRAKQDIFKPAHNTGHTF